MDVLIKIKYPNVYKKNVDIKKLTDFEKILFLKRIIEEDLDVSFIYNVLDSFPKEYRSEIASSLLLFEADYKELVNTNNVFNHGDIVYKCEPLIKKYFDESNLRYFTFYNNFFPYSIFSKKTFELICDKLTQEEIELLMKSKIGRDNIIEILIDKKMDIDYFLSKNDIFFDEKIGGYLDSISSERKLKIILNNEFIYDSRYFEKINDDEKLCIYFLKDRYSYDEKISIDELKSFILKYKSILIENKEKIIKKYYDLSVYCDEKVDIGELISDLDLDDDTKKQLIDVLMPNEKKKEKESKLINLNKEEIINYVLNASSDELRQLVNDDDYLFNAIIYKLPIEKQKEIIDINNDLIIHASSEFDNKYVNDYINNLSNDILISLFWDNDIDIELFYSNYDFIDENACVNFIHTIDLKNDKESEDVYHYLDDVLKIILEKFNPNFKYYFYTVKIKKIDDKYPNIIKSLDFSKYQLEDLLHIRKYFENDKDYLYRLLLFEKKVHEYYDEDLMRFFDLCPIEEIKSYNYESGLLDDIQKLLLSGKFNDENFEKALLLLNRVYIYNDDNNEQYVNLLNRIDKYGKLNWLFSFITEQNAKKAISNGIRYSGKPSDLCFSAKSKFMSNVCAIYENINQVIDLYKENTNLLFSFNFKLLNLFDIDDIKYFSKFLSFDHINIDLLLKHKNDVKKYIDFIKTNLKDNKEEIFYVVNFLSDLGNDCLEEYFDNFDINDTLYLSHEKKFLASYFPYSPSIDIVKKIRNTPLSHEKEILENSNTTRYQLIDLICNKMLGISYEGANDYIKLYCSDLDELIENSNISKEELEYIRRLSIIKKVINEEDINILRNTYINNCMDITPPNYIENLKTQELLRKLYNEEKIEKLYKPKDKDLIKTSNGVKIYEPNGEFNILLSVVGAYVKTSKLSDHPYQDWNNRDKNISKNICTSLISDANLSFARSNNSLIFGFSTIDSNDIVIEAPRDLGSDSNSVITTYSGAQFRTSKNMIDNTRLGHSELLLKRYIGDDKRQPDYIIAIGKVSKNEINAAKEFNIPIVVIDPLKITKRNLEKIKNDMNQLETKIDLDKLEELVLLFNNNYSGLISLDKKLINKYYKKINMSSYLMNYASKILSTNDEELINRFLNFMKMEKNKYLDVPNEYLPYSFDLIISYLGCSKKENIEIKQEENIRTSKI